MNRYLKKPLQHITVLFLYTLLTCLLLYPLPANFSTGLLEAQSGDPLMQIWVVQWNIHKLTSSLSHYFDANIFYPYSNTFAYHDHMFALGLIGLPIHTISQNPIVTYNVLLMLSFILSAYGMYLLNKEITHNDYAAFLAGLIFGFLPYRFAHLDHLNLLSIQWLPFCFLFLTRFLFSEKRQRAKGKGRKALVLFWVFFLLQALTSFNYIFMLSFAIGVQILICLGARTLVRSGVQTSVCSKRKFALLIIGGCIVGLLLLPFVFPYLQANREMGFQRTLAEAESLSARVQDYLVAPENNLLYGQFTRRFQSPDSPFPREQKLFNGILPMMLAIVGIFYGTTRIWHKQGLKQRSHRNPPIEILCLSYSILLIIAGILSLGPSASLLGKTIPLPYSWLYHIVPGFKSMRVPARFSLLVSFSLVVLAAIGLSQLYEYLEKLKILGGNNTFKYVAVTGLIVGIIILEYYSPSKQLSVYPGTKDTIPRVYQWLAQQKDDLRIIELPVRSAKDNFEYAYYSTFHWKRMVNGRSAFIPNGIMQIFAEMREFPSSRSVDLLESLGIQYVILHTEKLGLTPEETPGVLQNSGSFISLQAFDSDLLLEISPKTPGILRNSGSLNVQYHIPSSLAPDEQYTMGLSLKSSTSASISPLPCEKATFQIEWTTPKQFVHQDSMEIALPIFIQGKDQVTLPMQLTTPSELGDYQVELEAETPQNTFCTPLFEPKSVTKRVTILPDVLDSRRPGKLQAQFIQVNIPDVWESGKLLRIRVLVKNTGDTLWRARVADRKQPVGEVHLGVVDWREVSSGKSLKESHPQLFLSRGFLPYDVAPGEEIGITTNIRTPELPGEYLVQLDMVSELIQWFSDQGSEALTKKIILR